VAWCEEARGGGGEEVGELSGGVAGHAVVTRCGEGESEQAAGGSSDDQIEVE
jgi:hypothetical protein